MDLTEEASSNVFSKETISSGVRNLPKWTFYYLHSLVPIVNWIPHYNGPWGLGDLIAGLTIGLMAVPQSLSYATVAGLPPEYGLYSAFVGVIVYCLFATTKDVTIGPTAIMSLLVGQTIARVNPTNDVSINIAVATCYAFVGGFVMLGIGLFRLGFILEFISSAVVAGFTTGGAITVIISQLPTLLGIKGVNNRADTWNVVYNTFRLLPTANWVDCMFGLISALALVGMKFISRKYGKRYLAAWYIGVARAAIVVLIATLISWFVNRGPVSQGQPPRNAILKNVPNGFTYIAVPPVTNPEVMSAVWSGLPVVVVIALLEHVSIAKVFGRINGYMVIPSQECVALGVTNIAASFFGAFPATGSFSRSAVKSQSGVRTPLAGIWTGLVVLGAIFFLGPVFYWIPNASLSAVIMHGVAELISPPSFFKRLWQISPLDFLVTAVTIILACILTIEIAVEVAVPLALLILLLRLAFPTYTFLVHSKSKDGPAQWTSTRAVGVQQGEFGIALDQGIVVARLEENVLFPNATRIRDKITNAVRILTASPRAQQTWKEKGQTNWNEYGSNSSLYWVDEGFKKSAAPVVTAWNQEQDLTNSGAKSTTSTLAEVNPYNTYDSVNFVPNNGAKLRALILDLSSVNNVDATGAQMLYDLGVDLQRLGKQANSTNYIQLHFVNAKRNVRKTLQVAGVTDHQVVGLSNTYTESLNPDDGDSNIESGNTDAGNSAEENIEDLAREAAQVLPGTEGGNAGAAAHISNWKTVVGLRKILKSSTTVTKKIQGLDTSKWEFFHISIDEAVESIKEIQQAIGSL